MIDGKQCYILEVIPTKSGAVNWLMAQHFGAGPSLTSLREMGNPSSAYTAAYKSSALKLWISRDDYNILRSEVDESYDMGWATRIFHSEIDFSRYGVPVTVTLPPAAQSL